jgi:hypothetical protein
MYADKFDEALKSFDVFRQMAGNSKAVQYEVEKFAAACRVGKTLLLSRKDISVVNSQQLILYGFYSVYDYTQISGKFFLRLPCFLPVPTKKR